MAGYALGALLALLPVHLAENRLALIGAAVVLPVAGAESGHSTGAAAGAGDVVCAEPSGPLERAYRQATGPLVGLQRVLVHLAIRPGRWRWCQ